MAPKQKAGGLKAAKKGKATTSKPKNKSPTENIATILGHMAKMHSLGITEVDETELLVATEYKRPDSTGFRIATKKAIKELGYVSKTGKKYALTETGLNKLISCGEIEKQPGTNKEVQGMYKKRLLSVVKAPAAKLEAIWNVLIDGKDHTRDELLEAAGYKRPDSTGYRDTMKWFKKLGLIDIVGRSSFQFSKEKLFPFG